MRSYDCETYIEYIYNVYIYVYNKTNCWEKVAGPQSVISEFNFNMILIFPSFIALKNQDYDWIEMKLNEIRSYFFIWINYELNILYSINSILKYSNNITDIFISINSTQIYVCLWYNYKSFKLLRNLYNQSYLPHLIVCHKFDTYDWRLNQSLQNHINDTCTTIFMFPQPLNRNKLTLIISHNIFHFSWKE